MERGHARQGRVLASVALGFARLKKAKNNNDFSAGCISQTKVDMGGERGGKGDGSPFSHSRLPLFAPTMQVKNCLVR